ncbi:MAG: hypothetical protein R3E88_01640 [Myxococcota bacterium]
MASTAPSAGAVRTVAAPRFSAAYRALCAATGALLALAGAVFLLGAFRGLGPGAPPFGGLPLGPPALYFVAFTGCALVAWGGALASAAREPSRALGTWTAVGLVLMAVYRMAVWTVGDAPVPPEVPRIEAAVFLAVALAFVWLRPRAARAEA